MGWRVTWKDWILVAADFALAAWNVISETWG